MLTYNSALPFICHNSAIITAKMCLLESNDNTKISTFTENSCVFSFCQIFKFAFFCEKKQSWRHWNACAVCTVHIPLHCKHKISTQKTHTHSKPWSYEFTAIFHRSEVSVLIYAYITLHLIVQIEEIFSFF